MLCAVVTVIVKVPEPVTDEGLKLALECGGNELALKATVPLKLLSAPTLTVYEVLDPELTVWLEGDAEIEKSPPEDVPTTSVAVVEWVKLGLVPVIVKL